MGADVERGLEAGFEKLKIISGKLVHPTPSSDRNFVV